MREKLYHENLVQKLAGIRFLGNFKFNAWWLIDTEIPRWYFKRFPQFAGAAGAKLIFGFRGISRSSFEQSSVKADG